MFEKIKEAVVDSLRTPEESFRIKFEGKHTQANTDRSEDGAYIDQAIEAEWQQALAAFNEEEKEKFIDNQW
ncbi:hypothetical protein IB241_15605 [Pseudomonas sp. PDM05]|uniref:hypothetical protein n=1 Tax=Pseudomonas sp. PDM05 TaxID=2769301 RepID=UPI00177C6B3C|nr:hypothetical protein [Pseudomonas sp. PDM05]MBD9459108.1 hypothetical protein [Pseudomonas sp. PDM05]